MKKYPGIFRLLFASLVLFLGFVGSAGAVTNVSSCQMINSPGVYVLNVSIPNSSATKCIEIVSSDVVFDGQGYTVDGTDASYTYGIYVYKIGTTLSNVTVKNVTVTDWYYGIYYRNSVNGSITNNTANSNNDDGISLSSSSYNTLTNNNASNNNRGIELWSSSYNTLTNNTANSNVYYGIRLYYSSNNALTNNTMFANVYNFGIDGSSVQTIDITNTVDGKPIYYLVGAIDQVIDTSTNAGYVGVVDSINVTVKDLTLTRNGQGVLFANTSNSSISNITATNNKYGIYLQSSSNDNTLTNNTASNNRYGIYLKSSSSNTLTDNTVNSNDWSGIGLWASSSNTLTNNTANSNWNGIWLYLSSSNTLTGNNMSANRYNFGIGGGSISHFVQTLDTSNTVDGKPIYYLVGTVDQVIGPSTDAGYVGVVNSVNVTVMDLTLTRNGEGVLFANTLNSSVLNVTASNNNNGIQLYSSSDNTLANNTVNSNYYGIYLFYSSNNILTNNNASNNNRGIELLSHSRWPSSYNTIYNNALNNTNNFRSYGRTTNDWNTTKQSSPNIIGGPNLGGNFWAKPDGTGFSEQCTDADGDGICDSRYMLASGNVDYLPLTLNFVPPTTTTTTTTSTTTTTVPTTTTTTTTSTTTSTTTTTTTTTVPSQTTVAIDNATAPPMRNTTVSMTIKNVLDIGVADITLVYDRSVVQVLNVTSGDFDFMDAAIDNANGITRTGAMQMVNPGLNGSVVLAELTLKAVGGIGECSALNLSINELKVVGPPEADISATVVNGMFCIEETTPPSVINPSAHPESIPEDTDNNPTCAGTPYTEVSWLRVTVTDASGVLGVTANLSAIGGQHDRPMINISDTWIVTTSASIGSAIYEGADYLPHYLPVNATDIYNNTNSSMSIPLTVIKNGDVNEDGDTTLYDAMYLAKNVLGKPGFETITPGVAEVSGDCSKTLYDAMYLAKNVLGRPGFGTLR